MIATLMCTELTMYTLRNKNIIECCQAGVQNFQTDYVLTEREVAGARIMKLLRLYLCQLGETVLIPFPG